IDTKFWVVFVLAGAMAVPAFSQTAGTISGLVTDPSGALVAGATVTVTNPGTNLARDTTSNGAGNYNFPDLPPGIYNVKAAHEGFQTEIRNAIELQVQQTARI